MNIILISSNITNSGGTERIGIGLANELAEDEGTNVTIISLFGSGEPFFQLNPRVKILTLFRKHISLMLIFPIVIWKIRSILKVSKEQSIILNIGSLLSVFTLTANFGLKHKNIIWEHFNVSLVFKSKKEKFARYMASRYADAIVTLTQKDRAMYLEHFTCRVEVVCIPNFLTFTPQFDTIVKHKKIALAVGRLTEQKGFERLLEIWSQLDNRFQDWQLKIVGDGEDREKLLELVSSYGLKNVYLIPTTKDVNQYYNEACLYLMTSRWEGLPMVLIEAQSYGLPIISYDCLTGPRDIVSDGSNGFLIDDGDCGQFVTALSRCMEDDQLRADLSDQSFIDSKRFESGKVLQIWTDLFSKILFL